MRSINECTNNQLQNICSQVMQLEKLNVILKKSLPNNLVDNCYAASFTRGTLIIAITDPTWATELRFLLPQLRDQLRKDGKIYQLSSIKIIIEKVDFSTYYKRDIPKKTIKALSNQARQVIQSASELIEYSPLREALLHLSQAKKIKFL